MPRGGHEGALVEGTRGLLGLDLADCDSVLDADAYVIAIALHHTVSVRFCFSDEDAV